MSREAFEAWATSCNHSVDEDGHPGSLGHTYAYTYTEYAWRGWSARDAEVETLKAAVAAKDGGINELYDLAETTMRTVANRDARIAELEAQLDKVTTEKNQLKAWLW